MIIQFCPHCGVKLEPNFKFCPACGQLLPRQDLEEPVTSTISQITVSPSSTGITSQVSVKSRSPLLRSSCSPRKQRKTRADAESCSQSSQAVPTADHSSHSAGTLSSPKKRRDESLSLESSTSKDVATVKNKPKKARRSDPIIPVAENVVLEDNSGKKWRLVKLLVENDSVFFYGAVISSSGAFSDNYKHIVKLAAKEGKIFNEQNFLQRAAKPASVDKWKKLHKMDFLGVPTCVGFGLHSNLYRFLIFPDMGTTLQSRLDDTGKLLPEKTVLFLALKIIEVLEYIHENEYVHGDIQTGNIYVNLEFPHQVYLAGYFFAFRFSPNGQHVEYREQSRTPHDGTMEFISIDSHKGVGPSRRSDLQSLAYCMVKWLSGSLPWSDMVDKPSNVMSEKEKFKTNVQGFFNKQFRKGKIPGVLQDYMEKVMVLEYMEKPNYEELKALMRGGLQKLGFNKENSIDF
ncbi:inactive serine/threonine-protein kinase VRK3 isoform X3 [Erpetoichthys calabaricus]|uniref:Protein kinase domain-containing protein n=1 Tax=Erpetoichthys calabaricus TaxID=27687 RepID=A0A8C4S291_ERPCA|nr:inactive serine/threonine-protein kinase VRK3 isoform X3 [Erpetoichthys calabaricus]